MTTTDGPRQSHHLLLRRLHSLSGIVPIGIFLLFHLTTNASVVWGAVNTRMPGEGLERGVATFQHEVSWINNMPGLLIIEISLWLAIGFHSILGVFYAMSSKPNVGSYRHPDNWRYTLQRLTGYVGIFFILYHVATLRWGWTFLVPGGTRWSHEFAASTLAAALRGSQEGFTAAGVAVSLGYFIGITCLVFHFANGLWTAAITWGLTVSVAAQKRWGVVCAGLGVALMGAAWMALIGFLITDPADARVIEARMGGDTHALPEEHADDAIGAAQLGREP